MKFLTTILCVVLAAVAPAYAQTTKASPKKAHASTITAANAMEVDGMHYASISKTNPFEVIAPVGMGLNDDLDNSQLTADLLKEAHRYLGVRYVRGGKSPKGFDCSGFTSYIFRQFGFELSPSSSGQYAQGVKIQRDEIEAGDLLFFTGSNSGSGRVGHVGIAVSHNPENGEITFIHAARGGIKVDRISAPYYTKRYLGARRILSAN